MIDFFQNTDKINKNYFLASAMHFFHNMKKIIKNQFFLHQWFIFSEHRKIIKIVFLHQCFIFFSRTLRNHQKHILASVAQFSEHQEIIKRCILESDIHFYRMVKNQKSHICMSHQGHGQQELASMYTAKLIFHKSPTKHSDYTVNTTVTMLGTCYTRHHIGIKVTQIHSFVAFH